MPLWLLLTLPAIMLAERGDSRFPAVGPEEGGDRDSPVGTDRDHLRLSTRDYLQPGVVGRSF